MLSLVECAEQGIGNTAAADLMGAMPADRPEYYRLADPLAAVPLAAPVLCVHSRADDSVPFTQSERYVTAATAVGGRVWLHETHGDHFTVIDPASPDWQSWSRRCRDCSPDR